MDQFTELETEMKKILPVLLTAFICTATNAGEREETAKIIRVSHQQAACLNVIGGNFTNRDQERAAAEKFYSTLIGNMRKIVAYGMQSGVKDIPLMRQFMGNNEDILVGIFLGGLLDESAVDLNKAIHDMREGDTVDGISRDLWAKQGCDAIYAGL